MVSQLHSIRLSREDSSIPWGFRLEGGIDLGHPLCIQRVTPGSVAECSGLCNGDQVVRLNRSETKWMRHEDAKMEIIRSSNDLEMLVERGGARIAPARAAVTMTSKATLPEARSTECTTKTWQPRIYSTNPKSPLLDTRISLEASHQGSDQEIGVRHNVNPTPFGQAPTSIGQSLITKSCDGRFRKISHSTYNSPKGLYAKKNVDDTFERTIFAASAGGADPPPGNRPLGSAAPEADTSSKYCGACGEFIRGVFVKVQGRVPMHPECLKCCKCGVGLRNIGYFYINENLYCETHAKQAAPPPQPGMKPVVVYK